MRNPNDNRRIRHNKADRDEKKQDVIQAIGIAIVMIPIGLMLWGLASLYLWMSAPAEQPQLSEIENTIAADAARDEAEARQAFLTEQRPLWASSALNMTREDIVAEIGKCETAIGDASQSPYAILFDYDADVALKTVRARATAVKITSQQRHEFPNKVELASWWCNFRGAGYTSYSKEPGSQFMDRYIPG